ncbi:MAG: hypothetical protein VX438_16935, partial [Planctomycetota bacterium]|nr:hypothetical protein [Planctomycetota bacterium]
YDGNFLFFKSQLVFQEFLRDSTARNLRELEEIAQKSVTVRPNNSKVALETGKMFLAILLGKRELDETIRRRVVLQSNLFFKKAVERRPNDALHAAFRAYSYFRTGDLDNAKKWSEKAIELDKLNPHRDKDLSNTPFRVGGFESKLNIEQELIVIRNQS